MVAVVAPIGAALADSSCIQPAGRPCRAVAASGRARGFTLVEMVIVISIVAILVMFAAPSFQSTIQSARTTTEVNSLVNDLQFARSEAIKRGSPSAFACRRMARPASAATSGRPAGLSSTT